MTALLLRASTAPAETPETGQTGVPLALRTWGVLTQIWSSHQHGEPLPALCLSWGWLCHRIWVLLLLGSSLAQPGVGRMGDASTAPHFASITVAPLLCSEALTRVFQCCVGRDWWPGPILGLCGDPAHSSVPHLGQLGHIPVPSPM